MDVTQYRSPASLIVTLGVVSVALVTLLGIAASPASAQAPDPAIEEEMYRIADQLNCPICQGQRLSECPIQICEEMRAEIVDRLQEGRSEEEIIQTFVDRYGIQVLNQPPVEGFNVLAWVMPFVGLAVVLVIGGFALRAWVRRRPAEVPAESASMEPGTEDLPEDYVRRLEEELARDQ